MRQIRRIASDRSRPTGMAGWLLLVVLLVRAYVPVGFMPAAGAPFQVELCPAAGPMAPAHSMPDGVPMPAGMDMPMEGGPDAMVHHHAGVHGHFAHCPFGSAPTGAPIVQWVAPAPGPAEVLEPAYPADSPPLPARFLAAHPARGPPLLV